MSWNRQASSSTYAAADDDAWDGDIGDADDDLEYVDDDVGYTAPPAAALNIRQAYPGLSVCIVCQERPPYSKGRKQYPTCGLTCAEVLHRAQAFAQRRQTQVYLTNGRGQLPVEQQQPGSRRVQLVYVQQPTPQTKRNSRPPQPRGLPCAVCKTKTCPDARYVTCGLSCAKSLISSPPDPTKCTYCHRRPKQAGHEQCGDRCKEKAKIACLLCKSRPKYKRYHLCGGTCKSLATENTPLVLEAPEGHVTYDMVVKHFKASFKNGTPPAVKKVYKIIENKTFLTPYDQYKQKTGPKTEVFRYHGTSRQCTLGNAGSTTICASTTCALCSILRTSFKVSLARNGSFGAGVYSSSASSKAYGYMRGSGTMLLCKVVLGKPWDIANGHKTACPPGYDSVVYDPNGAANETMVYTDDAIRPVFLLVF